MAERLYYDDSFLKEFDATVTDVREYSRSGEGSVWQIALDRTAFYPTSGGQPFDRGSFLATAPSGASLQLEVQEVVEDSDGEVWHATAKPLPAGSRVKGTIAWERRLDHMQQHSGQHLLSAACLEEMAAATVSFHLGEMVSTIDLAIDSLSPERMTRIEDRVNRAIAEDPPVHLRTVSAEQAEALRTAGVLRKVPERGGHIRLVEMPGIDLNACGGTHVQRLGQIGGLLLRGTEKVRSGIRLSYVCGLRAVHAARKDHSILAELGARMSVGREGLAEAIERRAGETKALLKERQKLREELADYEAARLLVEYPIEHGQRWVIRRYRDRDSSYIKLLASRLVETAPQTLVLLVSDEREPASLVFAHSADLQEPHCGEQLGAALKEHGLRGGGSATMSQGQAPAAVMEAVVAAVAHRSLPSEAGTDGVR